MTLCPMDVLFDGERIHLLPLPHEILNIDRTEP